MFKEFGEMKHRGENGMGIGLSCSKTIVEALGGEIKLIESKRGKT